MNFYKCLFLESGIKAGCPKYHSPLARRIFNRRKDPFLDSGLCGSNEFLVWTMRGCMYGTKFPLHVAIMRNTEDPQFMLTVSRLLAVCSKNNLSYL